MTQPRTIINNIPFDMGDFVQATLDGRLHLGTVKEPGHVNTIVTFPDKGSYSLPNSALTLKEPEAKFVAGRTYVVKNSSEVLQLTVIRVVDRAFQFRRDTDAPSLVQADLRRHWGDTRDYVILADLGLTTDTH